MSSHVQRLLRPGTAVRLYREPKTDAVDAYGRLLRYVFRVRDGLNVNVRLVRVGEAAPYFYDHRVGGTPNRCFDSPGVHVLGVSACGATAPARLGTRTMASRPGLRRRWAVQGSNLRPWDQVWMPRG